MQQTALFHITSLSPLYEDVQSSGIFPDSKFFVDCTPIEEPEFIVSLYQQEKVKPGFELAAFVGAHFNYPTEPETGYETGNKPILQHLSDLWQILQRKTMEEKGSTLIPLPHPYIVPGGRFREVYYWDSFFTILGLQVSREIQMIQDVVDNFAYLILQSGFIPNANRTYYLSRSQPPFFALMVQVLCEEKGKETLLQYKDALEKEYAFWMEGADTLSDNNLVHRRVVQMPGGHILNRYWDDADTPRPEAYTEDVALSKKSTLAPEILYRHIRAAAESGWDFSSRWLADGKNLETIQTTDLIPVDLNCLMLFLETTLLSIYQEENNKPKIDLLLYRILRREQAIQLYFWNHDRGFYFDYHFKKQTFAEAYTLAAVFPLYFHVANYTQAREVATILEQKFLQAGGLLTTLANTGQQWDAPNGWAPLQWMAYKGLCNFDINETADLIRSRWMQTNERVYQHTGKMMEKYNVTGNTNKAGGGEYPNQDGFGWTNGVYLKLLTS